MAKTVTMTPELRAAVRSAKQWAAHSPAGIPALPYVQAALQVPDGGTAYYEDSLHTVLSYLNSNLGRWRGEDAKAAKLVIRDALK